MAKSNTLRNEPRDEIKPEPVKKTRSPKRSGEEKPSGGRSSFFSDERFHRISGFLLTVISLFLFISITSYLFTWKNDQALLNEDPETTINSSEYNFRNPMGRVGAWLGQVFVHFWFGIPSLVLPFLMFLFGIKLWLRKNVLPPGRTFRWSVLGMAWFSLFLGLVTTRFTLGADGFEHPECGNCMGGYFGFRMFLWMRDIMGTLGVVLILLSVAGFFMIYNFNPLMERLYASTGRAFGAMGGLFAASFRKTASDEIEEEEAERSSNAVRQAKEEEEEEEEVLAEDTTDALLDEIIGAGRNVQREVEMEVGNGGKALPEEMEEEFVSGEPEAEPFIMLSDKDGLSFEVEVQRPVESQMSGEELDSLVKEFGEYDPTLDLSRYELPAVEMLVAHGSGTAQIDKVELESNKNKIVETLNNYKIEIDKIKATIGPTVTLYEIVPAPGVRISKIKNLEDDIALSLSALGIRIIAPIPGKGTIGIEVPNSKPDVVSMRSLIASDKFQTADADLPVALGKTISGETFVADLAKMPHLLMAGATGQGKSVGLNAILVSLLYKKHPSQIKFVLVDPKKVELSLFNKIERHFLAKLPDEEEAIITDTSKVIKTLNSLCIEMDSRYKLLMEAGVRTIKQYNAKFVARRLNPNDGHRYLPYIVLVVDEFADLIMTAGKEVETPIARLAQLARAIGIHLIIATQRPSVNIITGTIKANFPARIAFRVTSRIDSRTILDTGGAEQLIGRGDMLYSTGNDLIRIQCGFVDTPEVEEVCEFIGSQAAYPSAYLLPEVQGEASGESGGGGFEDGEKDELFEEAARIIVLHQQGSTSLLQRKLKLGYNRAGRLIDQLEAEGIIGPFEGSKARKVLIPDEVTLEQFLKGKG
jgi:S-DNA-T family DNA segregation ATPase FtsK/SpoIIIE